MSESVGTTENARIVVWRIPANLQWLLAETFDARGNRVVYE
jgi:hypothetical protein